MFFAKVLPTTNWMQIINSKKIAKIALHSGIKVFVINVVNLKAKMSIYLAKKPQIALLIVKKVTIPIDYLNYTNIFSKKSAIYPKNLTLTNRLLT